MKDYLKNHEARQLAYDTAALFEEPVKMPLKRPKIDHEIVVKKGQTVLIKSDCGKRLISVKFEGADGSRVAWNADTDPFGPEQEMGITHGGRNDARG